MPIDRPEISRAFDRLYAGEDPQSETYRQGRAARAELVDGLATEARRADNGAPPPAGFPGEAVQLARLTAQDRNIRLVFLSLGGWDTHVNQGRGKGSARQSAAAARRRARRARPRPRQRLGRHYRCRSFGIRSPGSRERQWRHRSRPR